MASPRPSASLLRSPPSSRTSLETSSQPASFSRTATQQPRRNRAALRDYYGLKNQTAADSIASPTTDQSRASSIDGGLRELDSAHNATNSRLRPLDQEGFDAGSFVRKLLESEALGGLLELENELVADIRALDGERKALVYDNYSKLIAATDTIEKMRSNMDPLSPATSTLSPAISHIAETAASLAGELAKTTPDGGVTQQQSQVRNVQWVLDTPQRLEKLFAAGKQQTALQEWAAVQRTLDVWKSPAGTDTLKHTCQEIIQKHTTDIDDSGT
jgi:vacuolar protein sorting-associated protein 51